MSGKYLWDLSDEQLNELKRHYMDQHYLEVEDRLATDEELKNAENVVSYELLMQAYDGCIFFDSDFESSESEG